MDIAHFTLRNIAFEMRFPPAYRLWDASGRIWSNALERWPDLKLREAQPNQTRFTLGNFAEILIHLERAHTGIVSSKIDMDEFIRLCQFAYEQTIETLKVPKFTRIGLRPAFIRQYESIDAAVHDFISTGL